MSSTTDALNSFQQIYQGNMQAIGALQPLVQYTDKKDAREYNLAMYERQLADMYAFDALQYERSIENRDTQRQWALDDYARERTDALADYDRQRQDYLSDLADERAYNSPMAQVQRMLSAGLNPSLYYGNGSLANTSSGAQTMSAVSPHSVGQSSASLSSGASLPSALAWSPQNAANLMTGAINASMTDLQRDSARAEIELKRAEVIKTLRSADLDFSRKENQDIANYYADAMFQTDLQEKAARVNQIFDSMQTSFVNRVVSAYGMKLTDAQINNLNASTSKMFGELKSLVQQMEFFSEVKDYRVSSERSASTAAIFDNRMRNFEYGWQNILKSYEEMDLKWKSVSPADGKWYNHLWNIWKGFKTEVSSVLHVVGSIFRPRR